jgi:transcriptional regulator with XRE-family HTH domain
MNLGDRLRTVRKEKGMTQHELSKRVFDVTGHHFSRGYLCDIEKSRTDASVNALAKLAAGLGMTLQVFLSPVEFPLNKPLGRQGNRTE